MFTLKGDKNDELRRDKERQKTSNNAISNYKAIKSKNVSISNNQNSELAKALLNLPSKVLTLNSSMESTSMIKNQITKKNVIALKYMIKTLKITRFDINSFANDMKFVNVKGDNNITQDSGDNHLKKKIVKLLEQRKHKDEIVIPPTEYYDDQLNLVVEAKNYREILPRLNNFHTHS